MVEKRKRNEAYLSVRFRVRVIDAPRILRTRGSRLLANFVEILQRIWKKNVRRRTAAFRLGKHTGQAGGRSSIFVLRSSFDRTTFSIESLAIVYFASVDRLFATHITCRIVFNSSSTLKRYTSRTFRVPNRSKHAHSTRQSLSFKQYPNRLNFYNHFPNSLSSLYHIILSSLYATPYRFPSYLLSRTSSHVRTPHELLHKFDQLHANTLLFRTEMLR